jgi:TonB family protein
MKRVRRLTFEDILKKFVIILCLACVFAATGSAKADYAAARKKFAEQLQQNISRSGLHKIYVPDFTEGSGRQTIIGRFYAASFSKLLADKSKGFSVIPRDDAHRSLSMNGWTDGDLSKNEVLAMLVSNFRSDAILWGTFSVNLDKLTIDFVARDPSGKEIFRNQFSDEIDPFVQDMLENDESEPNYYFVMLDGVTMPKCTSCPDPPAPSRSNRVRGRVVLSVLVTAEGKTDKIRIIKKLDSELDSLSITTVKSWRLQASKDSDGKYIPVRIPVEVNFRFSN